LLRHPAKLNIEGQSLIQELTGLLTVMWLVGIISEVCDLYEISYSTERGDMPVAPDESMEDSFFGTVTVGERGQVVIPAEARKKLGIHTGDKLFAISNPSGEGLILCKLESMRGFLDHLTGQK
jgi:AbrB family looped-hinge helix DNA binding protein